jgi:outer membrane protein assembly factor BamB
LRFVENVTELLRLQSPAPKPQSIAFDGTRLWVGSIETNRLYSIDPHTWMAIDEGEAPGQPWGMTFVGDELRVITGKGPDDDRWIRRFIPGHGFKSEGSFRAPDSTGSQLGWDGDRLYLSQWYNQRILALDERGNVDRTIAVPHGICGQVVVEGRFYLVTTDDEASGVYWLTRVDARGATPVCEDIALIPFDARALTFDGERFWTNHREADQIVAFARPDA